MAKVPPPMRTLAVVVALIVGACGDLGAVQGKLQVLAGSENGCGYRDGPLATAAFKAITGLAVAPDGGIIVADYGNNRVRRVSPDGSVSTLLIEGLPGPPGLSGPMGVAVDRQGTVYVADYGNNRIVARAADGAVRVFAGGTGAGFSDAQGTSALFKGPTSVALGPSGDVYVGDVGNRRIRRITPDGMVATFAENVGGTVQPDVTALAVDPFGVVYGVSPTGGVVRYDPNGTARSRLDTDGSKGKAWPTAVAVDSQGSVYLRDGGSELVQAFRIHRLGRDPHGTGELKREVLVSDQSSGNEPGKAGFTTLTSPPGPPYLPTGLAVAPDGTVYFSRYRDCRLMAWRP